MAAREQYLKTTVSKVTVCMASVRDFVLDGFGRIINRVGVAWNVDERFSQEETFVGHTDPSGRYQRGTSAGHARVPC